jgi:hypothetical protein
MEGATKNCGTDTGACELGIRTCQPDGTWGPCTGETGPSEEICNNIDDDCDGQTDEDLTQTCSVNVGECREGLKTCYQGTWGDCENAVFPSEEICDFLDNDCDSSIDEGGVCDETFTPPCSENWECTEWSSCINETNSTRRCTDTNNCGTKHFRPAETRVCVSPDYLEKLHSAFKEKLGDLVYFAQEETVFSFSLLSLIGLLMIAGALIAHRLKIVPE